MVEMGYLLLCFEVGYRELNTNSNRVSTGICAEWLSAAIASTSEPKLFSSCICLVTFCELFLLHSE